MNMQCSKCGQMLNGNETFCPKCGNNVQQQPQVNVGVSTPVNEGASNNTNVATNAFVNTTPNMQQPQGMSGEVNFNPQQNYNNVNNGQPKKNYLGTISLVVGIVALIVGFKSAIFGLILGIAAIILASQYKKQTNQKTAGKVLGIISVVFSSISLILGLVLMGGIAFLAGSLGNGTVTSGDTLTCKYEGPTATVTLDFDYNGTELNKYKITGEFTETDYNIGGSITSDDLTEGGLSSDGFDNNDTDGMWLMTLSFMTMNQDLSNTNGVTINESEEERIISVEIDYTKMTEEEKNKIKNLSIQFQNSTKEENKTELESSGFTCN